MKWYAKVAALLAIAVCFSVVFCACDDMTSVASDEDAETDIDYTNTDISQYIGDVTYTGMTIRLDGEDASKEDALWAAILESAEIKAYPEDKVNYYFEQERASYMYLVSNDEKSYEALLKIRGITEDDMMADAREMVAKDLIYRLVVENEGIELTAEEKEALFDKYVDKYVKDYGYGKNYVTANMPDIIYDSMLYDKTMEYLIINNTFVTE